MRHSKRCEKCKRFISLTGGNDCWDCFIKTLMKEADESANRSLAQIEKHGTTIQGPTCKARGYEEPLPTFKTTPLHNGFLQIFTFLLLAAGVAGAILGLLWLFLR